MIETPHIAQTAAQRTAVIRFRIPREEIHLVMGPAFQEVMAVVTTQGIGPAGPLFSHHFRMDADMFDFEVGAPVTGAVADAGRVTESMLPAATVARTVYRGPYEGLSAAWEELMAWISAEGRDPAPDLWEVYAAGPESSADPTDWRTELNRPLLTRQ